MNWTPKRPKSLSLNAFYVSIVVEHLNCKKAEQMRAGSTWNITCFSISSVVARWGKIVAWKCERKLKCAANRFLTNSERFSLRGRFENTTRMTGDVISLAVYFPFRYRLRFGARWNHINCLQAINQFCLTWWGQELTLWLHLCSCNFGNLSKYERNLWSLIFL